MNTVRTAVIRAGGFAGEHHKQVKRLCSEGRSALVAVAEKAAQACAETLAELKHDGVRIYSDALELFRQEQGNIDLVTLPVGIGLHAPLAIAAMKAGYNVLVEKPPAATIQDVDAMLAASAATGKFCAVQFQQMSLQPLRDLKQAGSQSM
jgi:predicted dehydrogenase